MAAQKSPELEAQEDLQRAISEHKLAIQTALKGSIERAFACPSTSLIYSALVSVLCLVKFRSISPV